MAQCRAQGKARSSGVYGPSPSPSPSPSPNPNPSPSPSPDPNPNPNHWELTSEKLMRSSGAQYGGALAQMPRTLARISRPAVAKSSPRSSACM